MRVKFIFPALTTTVLYRDAFVTGLGAGNRVGIPDAKIPMIACLPRVGEKVMISPDDEVYPPPFHVAEVVHRFEYENHGGEQVVDLIML